MQTPVRLIDPWEARLEAPPASALRVGLVLPRSGVMGLYGPSSLEAAILAAEELNQHPGRELRRIEFVLVDSGQSTESVAGEVGQLVSAHAVDSFIGVHTSHTLLGVERAVGSSVPYVFAAGFEETRSRPNFFYPGETPARSALGLARIISDRGALRWAIVGTDYVWPREARLVQRTALTAVGADIVLDQVLSTANVADALPAFLDELVLSGAEGVIVNMPGRDLVTTLTALTHRHLDRSLIRFAGGSLEENTLYALGGDTTGTLYTSMNSFEALGSPKRLELNDRYRSAMGTEAPALNSFAEHCYDAVHLLAECDRRGVLTTRADATGFVSNVFADILPTYRQHLAVAEGLRFRIL
jgi:ABC-type branched-subunit amino acid transport system substrate-binding protein